MTTRFNNAVNALVHAFFHDTLAKGTCAACAVGNIVAYNWGEKVKPGYKHIFKGYVSNGDWTRAFVTQRYSTPTVYEDSFNDPYVKACIDPTGYTILEMAKIEAAFERNTKLFYDDDYPNHTKSEIMQDQYNGLMAVVEVLCELEGIEDLAEYKELFTF